MENNCESVLFLDCINFDAFVCILRKRLSRKVVLLNKTSLSQKFFIFLLKLFRYNVSEAVFFAGHLKTESGESAYLASSDSARKIAVDAAFEILESNQQLYELNRDFDKNTLHLHLTKQLVWYVKYWTERLYVAKILSVRETCQVCIKMPDLIVPKLIANAFPTTEIIFYSPTWLSFYAHIKRLKLLYLELFRLIFFPFNGKKKSAEQVPQNTGRASVLLLQEDTIRTDNSLRGQPHWIDFGSGEKLYNTYIIKSYIDNTELEAETKIQLEKNNVFLVEPVALKKAFVKMRNHDSLRAIRHKKQKLLKSFFLTKGFKNKHFAIRTALFLKQAEFMGAVSLWLNVRVFLFRESYIPLTDAIQLLSKELNVKTIACQYSNLGTFSPIMMNTADLMLIFSSSFRKIFTNEFFTPEKFIEIGYIYDGLPVTIKERAIKNRNILLNKGVKFIICFFDESVQYDKWGLVSKSDHLHELHVLVNAVLEDPTLGIVVKSQYQKNTPSRLYPDDSLITSVIASERFVELHSGLIRNDIFPSEAALIADIVIGHKFGATASLEAALNGTRSVMLDNYGTKTVWDHFYDSDSITFSTIESLMLAISEFRSKNKNFNSLGDWNNFLGHLSSGNGVSAIKRIKDIVEIECLN
jgi:hypothetical protein